MPLVSITRFRARALALLKDKNHVFWTMTMWEDERSMKAYMTSGAHCEAMPALADWADEASPVHASGLSRSRAPHESRGTAFET